MNNFSGLLDDISLSPSTAIFAIGCIFVTSYVPFYVATRKVKKYATTKDLDSPLSLLGKSKIRSSDKVDELYSNAQAFKDLSLQERLQLVLEIEACLPALGRRNWIEGEMAVTKLAPDDGTDHIKSKSSELPNFSSHVKNVAGTLKFSIASHVSGLLKNIKKNLEYQISIVNGESMSKQNLLTPPLVKVVTEEIVGSRSMMIHGPVQIPLIGHKFEIWASKDDDEGNEHSTKNTDGKDTEDNNLGIELIMGAGNQAILTFSDIVETLFTPSYRPVLLKLHPLRSHLFEVCSDVLKPLIDRGFFHVVIDEGIAENTALLCNPKVKHVRMTGGLSAAKKIEETLAESRPHMSKEDIQKMLTTELGCVTPWVMTPGTYTNDELRNAAEYITTSKKVNAGCNCLSANAVILPSEWSQKEEFKKLLRETLGKTTTDPLYYPGSSQRNQDIVNHYGGLESKRVEQICGPNIDRNGGDDSDFVPVFIVDCGTYGKDDYDNHALLNESFGPVLAIVELPGGTDMDHHYLMNEVVPFLNNKENIFGSLSCSILYPENVKDKIAIRQVVGALNYGTVALNTWSLFGYAGIPQGGIWGGSKYEVLGQSGRGIIGNIFQIRNAEKCVVYSESLTAKIILQKNVLIPEFVTKILFNMTVTRSSLELMKSFFLPLKD